MGSISRRNARYAPMDHSQIPGFPNPMPHVNWKTHLPKFRDEKGNNAALHLIKFYKHVCRLEVQFHEDSLMNMFMETLEDNARSWYEGLQPCSLCSLKYFYSVFCGNYKENH